jgi:hypothetical protein
MFRQISLAVLGVTLATPSVRAQRLDVWLEANGAHATPAAGLAGYEPATFAQLGARARLLAPHGLALDAAASSGRILSTPGRGWLAGSAAGETQAGHGRLSIGARLEGFATELRGGSAETTEFRHRSLGATVRPRLSLRLGRAVLATSVEATAGRLETRETSWNDRQRDVPILGRGLPAPVRASPDVAEDRSTLSLLAAGLDARVAVGPLHLLANAEQSLARRGDGHATYLSAAVSASLHRRALDLAFAGRWQQPDTGPGELGFQVALGHSLGQSFYGRIGADPLFGTPGHTSVQAGLTLRVGGLGGAAYRRTPVIEVGPPEPGGRRVRFQVRIPEASTVAVAGDFSRWEPWPLRAVGDQWVLETVLRPGLHRFSFVVDGERWMVPPDAPGLVDDGWGQSNATVLIEAH